ncbi:nucleotidyltransferase domain-containing protein [Rhizobium sp. BE258]|uniref:nucleotidyltransferase domain-containing protein n=1 Tax=Rhizobium sp. BE258 TaxID=2817722 RepID=UPI0028573875|nr:nucleotidyltransferase domain-containing protein [Rhizobium sp. BE258]MDR7141935.1 putative nucleotidyltransferase [Rhizobium sp. BE258]
MSIVDFMLSKRQQRMLAPMLLHPGKEFGTNELISLGGPGVGAGTNVIKELDRCGIVVKRRQGNQVIYSINQANPIYSELRSICLKTFGLTDVVTDALLPFKEKISLAFIFGSLAGGSVRPDSDVDLMVVADLDLFELGEVAERLEAVLGRRIDLNLHTPGEWSSLANDRVIKKIMLGKRLILLESPNG